MKNPRKNRAKLAVSDIVERVDQRLAELGISRSAAAKAAGLGMGAIRDMERKGDMSPRLETIAKLAVPLETTPECLAFGTADHIESDAILRGGEDDATVPIVGYVGASAETQFYPAGELDRVPAPAGSGKRTAALEIRGKSIGTMFDRWIAYFDDVRSPVTDDMIGRLCVVGLADGRTLVKKLARKNGGVVLVSEDGSQIDGSGIEWAALVKALSPR